jgi:hypothetical protein
MTYGRFVKVGLLAGGAAAVAILLPSSGSAQSPAPCEPGQTADVQVTTKDVVHGGHDTPLYATHEVELSAHVNADATNVQITPQPGVKVLKPGSAGQEVDLVMPAPPSLTVTVSWDQPDGVTQCSASKKMTFPVLATMPPAIRFVTKRAPRADQHNVTFYVVPARTGESLAPIELTFRKSARAALPSSHARTFRWSVPMRPGERKRYAKKIPALGPFLSRAKACRYWYLSCGAVFSQVEATTRGGAQIQSLSFRQPSRFAAPTGILVQTDAIGVSPRRFGFDIQARQGGRLIARYQRAGVCHDEPGSLGGVVNRCQISVVKNFPR